MPPDRSLRASLFETPAPTSGRKRLYTPNSVSDFRSHKKRRLSMASVDLHAELGTSQRAGLFSCDGAAASTPSLDRFISLRPEKIIPLTISPRTNRMCKNVGLLSGHRLSFKDENTWPSSSSASVSQFTNAPEGSAYDLLRRSASTLTKAPKKSNRCSVSQNLAQHSKFSIALDSPGLSTNVFSKPLSWSRNNEIAVACGKDVFYQNLATKKVSFFFRAGSTSPPGQSRLVTEATQITWGKEGYEMHLACATNLGFLEVWDAKKPSGALRVGGRPFQFDETVGSVAWNGHEVAWASGRDVYTLDMRTRVDRQLHVPSGRSGSGSKSKAHPGDIISMAWKADGYYLATGDMDGVVHVWDVRAQKMLTERGRYGKMRHGGPVKSLVWCPWKSDLLATGTFYPEGTIRTWNLATISNSPYEPEKVFSLHSAVHSLIWSPTCKELLSVHGLSFEEPERVKRQVRLFGSQGLPTNLNLTSTLSNIIGNSSSKAKKAKPKIVETPFTNAILVHDYPTEKRLLTLTNAHRHSITAASLGPDGTDVFTASPKEEVIKMWQVWGKGASAEKVGKAFSTDIIR